MLKYCVSWTCSVFADEIVFGFAIIVIPLEHVEPPLTRRSGRLVIHHHTHLVAAWWLIPVPVSTTNTHKACVQNQIHALTKIFIKLKIPIWKSNKKQYFFWYIWKVSLALCIESSFCICICWPISNEKLQFREFIKKQCIHYYYFWQKN